jgi:hypothetical protein
MRAVIGMNPGAKSHPLLLAAIFLGFLAVRASATTYYVDINSTNPTPPYTDWSIASTDIQSAVNQATNGDVVLVNDGVYQSGGHIAPDGNLSCVVVSNVITLESINGDTAVFIDSRNKMRCVYLGNGATLAGFTLTNGNSSFGGGVYCASTNSFISNCLIINNVASGEGAGICSGNLNNCAIIGNVAKYYGGGASASELTNCILTGNSVTTDNGGGGTSCTFNNCYLNNNSSVSGGAAYSSTLNNCIVSNNLAMGIVSPSGGGGVYGCIVQNSLIISNTAKFLGGGAYNSLMSNCVVQGNHASQAGGVAENASFPQSNLGLSHCILIGNFASFGGGFAANPRTVLTNCVICGNQAGTDAGAYSAILLSCSVINNLATNTGGGIDNCAATNSIVYYNTAPQFPNVAGTISASNCCFGQDVTSGFGFFTNAPLFVNLAAGDFHLQSNSPCINAGNNNYTNTTTDLDGNPRIVGGMVDIGAYEYQSPVSMVSYQWLGQYGLTITNGVDTSSPNGTGFTVYQDWIAGLNPTNPASVLVMLPVTTTNTSAGISVMWQSVSGIIYYLQSTTNLPISFVTIKTNIVGSAGTTSYADTSATNGTMYFYRVGVQGP